MPAAKPRLLMIRPKAASLRFVEELRGTGVQDFEPVLSPLQAIKFADALPDLGTVKGLIFTSQNGVDAYAALGGDTSLPVWAVGKKTALAARAAGFEAKSADGDADSLISLIKNDAPVGGLLHLRGVHSRGEIAFRLCDAGISTSDAIIYDQPARPATSEALAHLAGDAPLVVPIFSPRSALLFSELAQKAPLLVAAMSEAVAKPVSKLHIQQLEVAPSPESAEMLRIVKRLLGKIAATTAETK